MSDMLAPDGGEEQVAAAESTEATEQDTTQEKPGIDPDYISKIDQRFEDLSRQQQQMLQTFAEMFGGDDDESYEDDDTPLDEDDPDYEQQALQRMLDQAVQQRLAPHLQQQQIDRRNEAFDKLMQTYPELQDEAKHAPVVEQAYALAQRLTGQENPSEVINSPRFVELIEMQYKAMKADERAAQETPAGQRQDAHLEAGGRAAPESEEDVQERLMRVYQEGRGSF